MTFRMVTRAQWGARPPAYVNGGLLSAESTCHWNGPKVTVGGKPTWDHAKCASLVRGIQNFHMDSKGWSDIAYNFVVCPHGYTFEGRGLNVINGANGTNSGNRSSHAVMCLAGEGNPFPESEKIGFKETINYIDKHTLAPATCKGHRDHKSTECPGDARYNWVHAGMPLKPISEPAPIPPKPPQEDDSVFTLFFITETKEYYSMTNWAVSKLDVGEGYAIDLESSGLSAVVVPTKAAFNKIRKNAPAG